MRVEVHGHLERFLQLGHKSIDAGGIHQTGHILDRYHLGADFLHLHSLVYEILVGEDLLLGCIILGVYCVADSRVGDTAQLVDHHDRVMDVVDVVEGVEDTHHVQTVLDGLLVEALEHAVGIRHIAEKVTAAREGGEQRDALHCLRALAEAVPGTLAQITHHGIGHSTAPDFHDIEFSITVEGEKTVHVLLLHTRCEKRLLSVAKCQISNS